MPKDPREIIRSIRHTTTAGETITFGPGDEDELEQALEDQAGEEGQPSKDDALKDLTLRGAVIGFVTDIDEQDMLLASHDTDLRAKALAGGAKVQKRQNEIAANRRKARAGVKGSKRKVEEKAE